MNINFNVDRTDFRVDLTETSAEEISTGAKGLALSQSVSNASSVARDAIHVISHLVKAQVVTRLL